METTTATNILAAVEARAAEMGGTVVQTKRQADAYAGCAAGLVHWKRPNEHLPNGEEHITHVFYVRPGETVAIFEAGTYGDEESALAAWARRGG